MASLPTSLRCQQAGERSGFPGRDVRPVRGAVVSRGAHLSNKEQRTQRREGSDLVANSSVQRSPAGVDGVELERRLREPNEGKLAIRREFSFLHGKNLACFASFHGLRA